MDSKDSKKEHKCTICDKTYTNAQTYKTHLDSKLHADNDAKFYGPKKFDYNQAAHSSHKQ